MEGSISSVRGSTDVLNEPMDFVRGCSDDSYALSLRALRNEPRMTLNFVEEKRCERRCCAGG